MKTTTLDPKRDWPKFLNSKHHDQYLLLYHRVAHLSFIKCLAHIINHDRLFVSPFLKTTPMPKSLASHI